MAAPWLNGSGHFSFGCKSYKQSGCKGRSPTGTPIKHKIPHSESENIRESILDFTSLLGEINPDMPYLCRRGLSGPQKAVFAFIPSVRRGVMKKMLNLRFFAKKRPHANSLVSIRVQSQQLGLHDRKSGNSSFRKLHRKK